MAEHGSYPFGVVDRESWVVSSRTTGVGSAGAVVSAASYRSVTTGAGAGIGTNGGGMTEPGGEPAGTVARD